MRRDIVLVLSDRDTEIDGNVLSEDMLRTVGADNLLSSIICSGNSQLREDALVATLVLYVSYENGTIEVLKSRYPLDEIRPIINAYKRMYSGEIKKIAKEISIEDEIDKMAGSLFKKQPRKSSVNKFTLMDFE